MIPQKDNALQAKEEKHGSFAIFDIEHFLRRVIRNWYWFLILGVLGYSAAWFYNKYYTQNIFSSNLSLSISNNTASYFTPSQSINFIWGQSGNQDGVYLKKMLVSRSHNEYLVKELGLYADYSTKGFLKKTYLDKFDSPVFIEIDKSHLQQVNYPITLIPKGGNSYEVILPEEGHSTSLYNYETESFENIPEYPLPAKKTIKINEW